MFSLFSLPITVSGVPVSNGSIVLTLVGGPATIISTSGAAPSSYTFNLDVNGNPPAVMQVWGNQELSPAGTNYTYAVWSGANGTGSIVIGPFTSIVGPSAPYSGTLYPSLTVLPLLSFAAINGVNVTGTPSAGQVLTATGGSAATWQNVTVSGTFTDIVKVTGSASLPAAGGTSVIWAGGFSVPVAGRLFIGDGTGWQMLFSKRNASVTTDLFTFQDNGNFTATGSVTAASTSGGAVTGTSFNKVAITAPATSATLTIANGKTLTANNSLTLAGVDGKTLTVNNTLTFAGTDSITHTFPASSPTGGVLAYGLPKFQLFTSSGTWTIPTGVTAAKAIVVGGGGAGSGSTTGTVGAGGGGGGTAIKWLSGLTPGNTITVTVGTGGTGVSNAAGNGGNNSSISSGTQTITTVTAGAGSGSTNGKTAGSGGTCTNGDLNIAGCDGTFGISGTCGGTGGSSALGGGARGAFGFTGLNAVAYGGGGGGSEGATFAGGNGANGVVIFEWVS